MWPSYICVQRFVEPTYQSSKSETRICLLGADGKQQLERRELCNGQGDFQTTWPSYTLTHRLIEPIYKSYESENRIYALSNVFKYKLSEDF